MGRKKQLRIYDPATAATIAAALPEKLAVVESLRRVSDHLHGIAEQSFQHPATKYYSMYVSMLEQHCRLVIGDIERDIYRGD